MKKLILFLLIPIFIFGQPKQSSIGVNSTYTALGSAATFTGTWEKITSNYNSLTVIVRSDKSSAASGLKIELSRDGKNINAYFLFSYAANDTTTNRYTVPLTADYYRVIYTNTTSAQTTFSLTSILNEAMIQNVDALGNVKNTITQFPNSQTYADIRNSWDWARSFAQYSDTVKVNSVAKDTLIVGGSEWAKVTIRGKASTDSLYFGVGTTAPTTWTKIIGTTPFVTEKLSHTYFTKVFIKGYGAASSIRSYEVTIEAF